MTVEQLQELEQLRQHPAVQRLMEYVTQYLSYTHGWLKDEEVENLREKQYNLYKFIVVHDLVDKHPGELGFILQCKDYAAYIATYTEIGGSAEEAAYSAEEFKLLKDFFGDEE